MATWHHLTHRASGEEQIVAGLDGIDLDVWAPTKLAREPKPHEEVVAGKIRAAPDKAKRARGASSMVHLTIDELEALIDGRIQLALKA